MQYSWTLEFPNLNVCSTIEPGNFLITKNFRLTIYLLIFSKATHMDHLWIVYQVTQVTKIAIPPPPSEPLTQYPSISGGLFSTDGGGGWWINWPKPYTPLIFKDNFAVGNERLERFHQFFNPPLPPTHFVHFTGLFSDMQGEKETHACIVFGRWLKFRDTQKTRYSNDAILKKTRNPDDAMLKKTWNSNDAILYFRVYE